MRKVPIIGCCFIADLNCFSASLSIFSSHSSFAKNGRDLKEGPEHAQPEVTLAQGHFPPPVLVPRRGSQDIVQLCFDIL